MAPKDGQSRTTPPKKGLTTYWQYSVLKSIPAGALPSLNGRFKPQVIRDVRSGKKRMALSLSQIRMNGLMKRKMTKSLTIM